jgi:aminoglycoside phosphotransferase family enzyme
MAVAETGRKMDRERQGKCERHRRIVMATMSNTGLSPRQAVDMPTLAAKVAFLSRPDSYPEPTAQVEALETHMSWLFLTDQHAYKLKKPFHRDQQDYRTPAARRRSCARELRLNQRLAPHVYLDVVALTMDVSGRLALGGSGQRIDWLVRMRRMPAALSLEQRLRAGMVNAADAHRVVARLVPFFAAAWRAHWTPVAYRRRLVSAINRAATELARPTFGLTAPRIEALAATLRHFVATRLDLLDARVQAGRIVEGHGDLRPEHIYLTDPPTIIDCIEFDRNLRLRDPVDELSFLAMECDRLDRPELDEWLFSAWRELAADDPPRALIEYYKAHNAFVRAQIAIWHLDEPAIRGRQRWIDRAEDYMRRASDYLARI